MSKCLLEEGPKFFFEQRDQGLTNFALKFIWEQSETETGCGSGCLQLRIDAACFGMEVIRDGLFDFGFQFRVVLDLGTNVALEFILDEVAKSLDDQVLGGHQFLQLRLDASGQQSLNRHDSPKHA